MTHHQILHMIRLIFTTAAAFMLLAAHSFAVEPPLNDQENRFEITLFAQQPQIVNPIGVQVDNRGRVYVIEGNKVRFIEVTTGITGEADIEVTSGVQSGMEIVRGPSRVLKTLKDGSTIKRQTKKPGANSNEAS